MSVTRDVTYEEGNAGLWGVTCADCPLLAHLKALGMKPRNCVSGIATNMQGHIVMNSCEHFENDSLDNKDDGLTVKCNHEDPTP